MTKALASTMLLVSVCCWCDNDQTIVEHYRQRHRSCWPQRTAKEYVEHLAEAFLLLMVQCAALRQVDFSKLQDAPTEITHAQVVEASAAVPGYCQVQGYVSPQVGFEIRLPTSNWNRKFLMAGCGGFCGALYGAACEAPLRKGYACIVTDMGHKGAMGDALWAYHNLQAKLDYGYRATHVATLAGKAITERHYRSAPKRSYFAGCSSGGRQGLVSAQRFPWNFDGIIAGAPTIDTAALAVYILQAARLMQGANGDPILPPSSLQVLHEAALARCDLDDGIKDRIISHPSACRFDPGELLCKSGQTTGCLTEAQIKAARALYAGVSTAAGQRLHPGPAIGSEISCAAYPLFERQMVSGFRYLKFMPDEGHNWNPDHFNAERDYKRALMMEPLYSAANPDLRAFQTAGGKLILYNGWNDVGIAPQTLTDYCEAVERTLGGRKRTQESVRLFVVPGMGHCAGGEGAHDIDYLSALEAWVEQGVAPEKLIGTHPKPQSPSPAISPATAPEVMFSRPIYPYPEYAKYRGHGDPRSAESFVPSSKLHHQKR